MHLEGTKTTEKGEEESENFRKEEEEDEEDAGKKMLAPLMGNTLLTYSSGSFFSSFISYIFILKIIFK